MCLPLMAMNSIKQTAAQTPAIIPMVPGSITGGSVLAVIVGGVVIIGFGICIVRSLHSNLILVSEFSKRIN